MQLPAISSLVSLLSGSITGLKDLVTNATSLIAAAYFGLLHLAIIFPPLRDSGFLPIVAFERLPTVWQVVLGTLIISTLAFILSVMGQSCLLYTSDAADERSSVDLGGRRIIKKKKNTKTQEVVCNIKTKKKLT